MKTSSAAPSRTRFLISPQDVRISPVLNFIRSYSESHGLGLEGATKIEQVTERILRQIADRPELRFQEDPIELSLHLSEGALKLDITNPGVPILEEELKFHPAFLSDIALEFVNRGRHGQVLKLSCPLENPFFSESTSVDIFETPDDVITIRRMEAFEARKLTKLFFKVYVNKYIHDWIYFPEEIERRIKSGAIISYVASTADGNLLGHVALVKYNETPLVYDVGLGVVDPEIKSQGIFRRLFSRVMDEVENLGSEYCVFDMVTNHHYSQKEVFKYPSSVMALNVGVQNNKHQAKLEKLGIGNDAADMDRYTILMAIRSGVKHPFGQELVLPPSLGESLDFLLPSLNLNWRPSSRFSAPGAQGSYTFSVNHFQESVSFEITASGLGVIKQIVADWKNYLKAGFKYASVDIPLGHPGLGLTRDLLGKQGFFLAGLVPHNFGNELCLRLQCLGHTRVSWENIKLSGSTAHQLLEVVRADHDRNAIS